MEELEAKISQAVAPIVSQLERHEGGDDHLLKFQLRKAVESIEASSSGSGDPVIDARLLVLRGSLHRYTDESALADSCFRNAICLSRGRDRRPFLGMYLIHCKHRPLLSLVYLIKSGIIDECEDLFTAIVGRLTRCPSELRDVPPAARAAVIAILSGSISGRVSRLLPAAPPSSTESNWDTLCVILLLEILKRNPRNDRVEELIKLLVGRAFTFDLPLTLLAAIDFEPTRIGMARYRTSPVEQTTGSLSIDHLIGVYDLSIPTIVDVRQDIIAKSRLMELGFLSNARDRSPNAVPIIVDAANVAHRAAESTGTEPDEAALWALKAVEDYYVSRGHEVTFVVSDKHINIRPSSWRDKQKRLDLRQATALLEASKSVSTEVVRVPAQNHDDSYMIATALRQGGVVITNDMFRDWKDKIGLTDTERGRLAEKWTKTRLIAFTFVRKAFQPNPDFKMPKVEAEAAGDWTSLLS